MSRVITLEWLQKRDACEYQRGLFLSAFVEGSVQVNAASIRKARFFGLNVGWLAGRAYADGSRDGAAYAPVYRGALSKLREDYAEGRIDLDQWRAAHADATDTLILAWSSTLDA